MEISEMIEVLQRAEKGEAIQLRDFLNEFIEANNE